jgi:hypothetical protein
LLLQDEMAHAGYRTLLVGQRELSREEYEQWEAAYSAAQVGRLGCSWLHCCMASAHLVFWLDGNLPSTVLSA